MGTLMAPVSSSTGIAWISCVAVLMMLLIFKSCTTYKQSFLCSADFQSALRYPPTKSRQYMAIKKPALSQTGLEYFELKGFRSLDLTYLSRYIHRDGVGTLPSLRTGFSLSAAVAGCQGFIGPYPSAFLDKWMLKN